MSAPAPDPEDTKQPRTLYFGDGPWEGDADFKAWQRRSYSINRWDLLAIAFPVGGLIGAAMVWSATSNVVLANVVFFLGLALGSAMAIRKWWWSHTGS